MIDPKNQAILQEVVSRESRSLLSYIGDAYPWATAASERSLARLHELVADSKHATTELGTYLTSNRVPMPCMGSYPASFTSWNFLSLDYLLPKLAKSEESLTAQLASDVAKLTPGEARGKMEHLLALKRRNLEVLQLLATPAAA